MIDVIMLALAGISPIGIPLQEPKPTKERRQNQPQVQVQVQAQKKRPTDVSFIHLVL